MKSMEVMLKVKVRSWRQWGNGGGGLEPSVELATLGSSVLGASPGTYLTPSQPEEAAAGNCHLIIKLLLLMAMTRVLCALGQGLRPEIKDFHFQSSPPGDSLSKENRVFTAELQI